MTSSSCNLIFVYNADASLSSLLNEVAHKLFDPDTFECSLCELTYSYLWQKRDWVDFLKELPCEYRFYLRNRFLRKYPDKAEDLFPCVYGEMAAGELEMLVRADAINQAQTLEELKELMVIAVAKYFV